MRSPLQVLVSAPARSRLCKPGRLTLKRHCTTWISLQKLIIRRGKSQVSIESIRVYTRHYQPISANEKPSRSASRKQTSSPLQRPECSHKSMYRSTSHFLHCATPDLDTDSNPQDRSVCNSRPVSSDDRTARSAKGNLCPACIVSMRLNACIVHCAFVVRQT